MPLLLVLSSIFTSNSKIKSPYSFSVTKNELGDCTTVYPVIAPSSTLYKALPAACFQPLSVLPSNKFCQPFCACNASTGSSNKQNKIFFFMLKRYAAKIVCCVAIQLIFFLDTSCSFSLHRLLRRKPFTFRNNDEHSLNKLQLLNKITDRTRVRRNRRCHNNQCRAQKNIFLQLHFNLFFQKKIFHCFRIRCRLRQICD